MTRPLIAVAGGTIIMLASAIAALPPDVKAAGMVIGGWLLGLVTNWAKKRLFPSAAKP